MELKVYLQNLYRYTIARPIGEWVTLPIEPTKLEEIKEKILSFGGEELFISEANFPISEYANLDEYNNLFLYAQENNILEDAVTLLQYDISTTTEEVMERLEDSSYSIIDAENDEELGRYVVEEGLIANTDSIKQVPEHYINFELIGEEYSINENATKLKDRYVIFERTA